MATECIAYRDAKGVLHSTAEKATLADLSGVLGRVGEEGGMTAGVAKLIFEKRHEIERVFAEHDHIVAVHHEHDEPHEPHEPHDEGGDAGNAGDMDDIVQIVDTR